MVFLKDFLVILAFGSTMSMFLSRQSRSVRLSVRQEKEVDMFPSENMLSVLSHQIRLKLRC